MKGQVNIFFIISAMAFSALLVYVAVMLLNFSGPYFAGPRQDIQEMRAIQLSDTILSTKGRWENATNAGDDWEAHPDQVSSAGLASSYHNLSSAKITAFKTLNDSQIREMYGNDSSYSFCIRETGARDCTILNSTSSSFQGKIVRRYAHYIDRTVEVMTGVW